VRRVLVGYGQFNRYRVRELPNEELQKLAERFPLSLESCQHLEWDGLLITVAVHEELARRARGGEPDRKIPSERELAKEIINKGFKQLSHVHHPDKASGDNTAQRHLLKARDQLTALLEQIEEGEREDDIVIEEPKVPRGRGGRSTADDNPFGGMTDDDVPF
jgi:hypothetical protein